MKMCKKLGMCLLSLLPMVVVAAEGQHAVQVEVQVGQDLSSALREVREMRRLGKVSDRDTVYVTLADGDYPLTEPLRLRPEDSGTRQGPTIIRAAHAGQAVLRGSVPLQGWRRPTSEELRGVPERVRPQVWVCEAPLVQGRRVETRQLWQGAKRLPQASLVPQDSLLPMLHFDREHLEIWIAKNFVNNDLLHSDYRGWMLVHQRWAIALLRLQGIRLDKEVAKISFQQPESRREFEHPWPQPVINDTLEDGRVVSSSFNLYGHASFLDHPGEWVQRPSDGLIYIVSADKGGARPMEPIYIPVTEQLVQVEGGEGRPVHDIVFEGISFRHTAWTAPNREGWVTLQAGFPIVEAYKLAEPGLPHKASLENQAWIDRPQSAISLRGAQRVNFSRCQFAQLGACGVDYEEQCAESQVTDCQFEDIGATAILVGHFATGGHETHAPFLLQPVERLCHDILLSHNEIHHVGMEDWGACAINAGFVYNTTIADNVVSHCKWSGICLGWGWMSAPKDKASRRRWPMKNNHLLRNQVSHFGLQLHDCGALYTLSYQPNSSIVGNRLDNMGRAPFATNNRAFYIYLDEATDGFTIQGNEMPERKIGENQIGKHVVIKE